MRLKIIRGSEIAAAKRPLSEEELKSYVRLTALGQRIGAYGLPFVILPWPFLQDPTKFSDFSGFDVAIFLLIILFGPLLHEAIHILALPNRIRLDDSMLIVRVDGFKSGLLYRPGGALIGIQFAWMCVLPFLLLTVLPYLLTLGGYISSIHFGILAGYNFGLSGIDLIQAAVFTKEAPFKKIS